MKKSFTIRLSVVALIAIASLPVHAQSVLETDAVSYRYDSSHALVEVNYGVLERGLSFKQIGKTYIAIAKARAEIWQNGVVAQKKDISDTVRCTCRKDQLDSAGA